MDEKKCSVCGTLLNLTKDKTYLVKEVGVLTGRYTLYDAIDCEQCGCQNILKERKMRVEDGQKES